MYANADLSAPPPELAALSRRLAARLRRRIEAAGGWLDFADYMRAALYEPGLGYYSAGTRKFGPDGDFVTAPELTPLFGRCVARAVGAVLEHLDDGVVLEIGPGSGALAASLLPALASLDRLPREYLLLEVSADLRQRQQSRLGELDSGLAGRLRWLDELPAGGLHGVVVANEVLDALPVSRFVWRDGQARPLGVGLVDTGFGWAEGRPDRDFAERVAARVGSAARSLSDGYRSEYCPALESWLAGIAAPLEAGALIMADYGLVRDDYYAPQRRDGTLVCHYRHRVHDDPFRWPGAQDISAWVDFSAVAQAGRRAGLMLAGFGTQAAFLLANGADIEAAELQRAAGEDPVARLDTAQALQRLLLPGEMGEYFKFLALSRRLPAGVPRMGRDLADRL